MAWKQVSTDAKEVSGIEVYGLGQDQRARIELVRLLHSEHRNFVVPLANGGVLRTERSVISQGFKLEVGFDGFDRKVLLTDVLHHMRSDHWNTSPELTITAMAPDGQKKRILCQVNVKRNEDEYPNFVLVPVLPKELSKGREGVRVYGTRTIEGIDEGLNETALLWSRELSREFGIHRKKLDTECVKSVCVEPRMISNVDLVGLMDRQNLEMRFVRGYNSVHSGQQIEMVYRDGKLVAEGYNNDRKEHWESIITKPVANLLEETHLPLLVDLTKPISFEQHYYTELSLKIGNAYGRINERVSAFFEGLKARRKSKKVERNQKLVEKLSKMGVGDDDAEGAICIVQYEPACLLRDNGSPTAGQAKEKQTA